MKKNVLAMLLVAGVSVTAFAQTTPAAAPAPAAPQTGTAPAPAPQKKEIKTPQNITLIWAHWANRIRLQKSAASKHS